MDASLLSLLPTGGVATVLVIVIVYLLRQNHADREQYRTDVSRIQQAHVNDIAVLRQQQSDQVASLEAKMQALQDRVTEALNELESERRRRWHAEDVAAEYRRDLVRYGHFIDAPAPGDLDPEDG